MDELVAARNGQLGWVPRTGNHDQDGPQLPRAGRDVRRRSGFADRLWRGLHRDRDEVIASQADAPRTGRPTASLRLIGTRPSEVNRR